MRMKTRMKIRNSGLSLAAKTYHVLIVCTEPTIPRFGRVQQLLASYIYIFTFIRSAEYDWPLKKGGGSGMNEKEPSAWVHVFAGDTESETKPQFSAVAIHQPRLGRVITPRDGFNLFPFILHPIERLGDLAPGGRRHFSTGRRKRKRRNIIASMTVCFRFQGSGPTSTPPRF